MINSPTSPLGCCSMALRGCGSATRICRATSTFSASSRSRKASSSRVASASNRSISSSSLARAPGQADASSSQRTAPPASTQLSPLQSPHAYLLEELAKRDNPSYLAHHFYSKPLQTHYAAIRTFNVEIAGLKDTVSNELLGRMRMGWWRDAVQGAYQVSSLFPSHASGRSLCADSGSHLLSLSAESTSQTSRRACTARRLSGSRCSQQRSWRLDARSLSPNHRSAGS